MQVSLSRSPGRLLVHVGINACSTLAILLTLGLLTFPPLGADADRDSVVYRFTRRSLDERGVEVPTLAAALPCNIALHLAHRLLAAASARQHDRR